MKLSKNFFVYIKWIIYLTNFDIRLHKYGFNHIFKLYSNKYSIIDHKDVILNSKQIEEIELNFEALDVVCAWYPRKADCIHKTFLSYCVLRKKYGVPVDMVIGLRKFPFEAHAWIQLEGNNFFGDFEETEKYKIVLKSSDYFKE